MDRRSFLRLGAAALVLPLQTPSDADPLRDPAAAGRSRQPVGDLDNSEMVKAVERRLKCTCPCNLDVFTCRTTDFTCEYSPAMHREVMGLVRAGSSSEQVIAAFIAKYGERVLMAPPPVGFNLAGYLVPGVLLTMAVSGLAFVLLRRHRMVEAARTSDGAVGSPAAAPPTPEEMDRLKQALSEVAD